METDKEGRSGMLRDENGNAIEIGSVIGDPVGAVVMAMHTQEGCTGSADATGVVLGWSEHKREFWVWSVGPTGELSNGRYKYDLTEALNVYSERVMARLFGHYNKVAPTWTYQRPNRQ